MTLRGVLNAVTVVAFAVTVTVGFLAVRVRAFNVSYYDDPRVAVVDDWRYYATVGARLGADSPLVTITVFSDYTCPNCRDAFERLQRYVDEFPRTVTLVVRHFPLNDGVSRDAAIAGECGWRAGVFRELSGLLFDRSEDLGRESWITLAEQAGVMDLRRFSECMADSTAMARVARDLRDGYRLGIAGTPSFLFNDRFFEGNPPPSFLRGMLEEGLSRGAPRIGSEEPTVSLSR